MLEVTGRLHQSYINAGIFYQDAWHRRLAFHILPCGNVDMYTNSTTSYNIRFHQNRLNVDVANFYYRNFNIYLGARYENFRSPRMITIQESAANRTRVKENLISYRAGVRYDSYDNAYYPSKGVQFNAEYALYTDDFAQFGKNAFLNIFSFAIHCRSCNRPSDHCSGPLRNFYTVNLPFSHRILPGVLTAVITGTPAVLRIQPTVVDNKFCNVCGSTLPPGQSHYLWVKRDVARKPFNAGTYRMEQGMYMLGLRDILLTLWVP